MTTTPYAIGHHPMLGAIDDLLRSEPAPPAAGFETEITAVDSAIDRVARALDRLFAHRLLATSVLVGLPALSIALGS